MTNGNGLVIIGGKTFPVAGIRLRGGGVQLEIRMCGPQQPVEGPITVIGEDGAGCWQGRWYRFPEIPRGDMWTCYYGLRQAKIENADEVVDFGGDGVSR